MNQVRIPDPVQDPKLFEPVNVLVLRPFCVAGKPVKISEAVQVPRHLAQDLRALGKAEFI
ncbi:MAG: hypothetical protein LV473_22315 [Nitrospira sp.]|nr:hypothetical protein [Nitrospira sp.]